MAPSQKKSDVKTRVTEYLEQFHTLEDKIKQRKLGFKQDAESLEIDSGSSSDEETDLLGGGLDSKSRASCEMEFETSSDGSAMKDKKMQVEGRMGNKHRRKMEKNMEKQNVMI